MRFSQDFIEKVRDANDIGEIIGQYTELKGTGHRLMGRCPFPDHSDKSPSFSVTEDQQLFYCYGCKKGGSIFNFLELFNGMNFPEAIEYLARRANIALPEPEAGTKRVGQLTSDEKDMLLKVNRATAVYFHHNLKSQTEDSPVRKYLVKRGLTDEIVDKFRLGFSTEEWQGLGRHLVSKGVKIEAMEKLQLIKPKKSAVSASAAPIDKYFDLFRDRLMFPIFAGNGDTLGFGGRVLDDTLPKYVNSADSPVFHKSKVLYGLHETGKFIRAQDEVIVVEGYMDAIALCAAGFKNVVAILGTAMTPEHAKLIKRYTLNVKMLLDGDEAGINAAEKSLPILLAGGLLPKGLILPEKLDPDEFIRDRGADALRTELDRAPELFHVLLTKRWLSNYHGSDSEKVAVISEAAVALGPMANRSLMELYLLELSRQLDVDAGWVRRAVQQAVQALAPRQAPGSAPGAQTPTSNAQVAGGPGPSRPAAASRPITAGQGPSRPQGSSAPTSPSASSSARPLSPPTSPVPPTNNRAAVAPRAPSQYDDGPPAHLDFAPPDDSFIPLDEDHSPTPHLADFGDNRAAIASANREAAARSSEPLAPNQPEPLTNDRPAIVSLKGAPKDESFVMSLLLYNESLLRELMDAGIGDVLKMFSHPGIQAVLSRAVERYQAKPAEFAKIAPGLTTEVDMPSLLASSLPLTAKLSAENSEKKLMADYLNAIRLRYMKAQGKTLINQMRERPTTEMLEQVQALQRQRLGKGKDS